MNRFALFLATLSLTAAVHGCVATPGRPVQAFLTLAFDAHDVTTSSGWAVHLDEASLLVSAVRVRDATMPAAVALLDVLGPRAFAHGGHGEADATVLVAWAGSEIVSLGEERTLLPLDGRAGSTDRLAVVLGGVPSASDPHLPALHGLEVWVAGTATQGASSVAFAGGLDLPEAEAERLVEGVAVAGAIDDDVTVRVAVDISSWLDGVHFERLVPEAGVAPIAEGSQAAIALRLGVGDLRSYLASVSPLAP